MNPARCLLAVCAAVLAAMAPLAAAQVAVAGRHALLAGAMAPAAVTINAAGERVQTFAAVPFFELPYQDNDLLRLMDEAERTRSSALTRMALPYKFAEPVSVYVDFMASALATTLPNGDRVLRWGVRSTGALSLSVLFDKFRLPRGAEFYVHNEHETLGAFTAEVNNKEHLNFAVRPIPGEYLMLEYFEPAGLVYDVEPLIVVSEVVHGFKSIFNTAASGSCNINAVCKSNFEPQISSVGMLLTDSLSRYCSGSLVNNARGDGRQLFLTANHCMGSSPTKHIIMFNYQTPTCSGGTAPTKDTVQGLTILGQYDNSDFALLEIQERIPETYNVYLNGISAATTAPVNPVCVHHPAGDVKKISVYNGTATDDCWSECPNKYHWRIPAWTEGTTEGGSSGSPLFDGKTRYVVGQLHGGSASCANTKGYDAYGKVANSWDTASSTKQRLRDVLDPLNTGVREIPGISLAAARKN